MNNTPVVVIDREGRERKARVQTLLGYQGLERLEREEAGAGDIDQSSDVVLVSLAERQREVAQRFARRGADKFCGIPLQPADGGALRV